MHPAGDDVSQEENFSVHVRICPCPIRGRAQTIISKVHKISGNGIMLKEQGCGLKEDFPSTYGFALSHSGAGCRLLKGGCRLFPKMESCLKRRVQTINGRVQTISQDADFALSPSRRGCRLFHPV